MSIIDITIILIMLISLIIGIYRGFVREALSLCSWVAAIWLAYHYAWHMSSYLASYIEQSPLRVVLAYALIFVVSLLIFSAISHFLHSLASNSGISGVDRSLGVLFGVTRGIAIITVLILVARFMDFTGQPWWSESMLVTLFDPVIGIVKLILPEKIVQLV